MTEEAQANTNQGTPSYNDLEIQLAKDEASRNQPEAVTEEAQEAEPEAEQEIETPAAPDESEYEKRIARLAHQEREARRLAKQLQEENARLRGAAPPLPKDEEIARQVEARAAELAARKAFDDQANAIYSAGVKAYGGDFDAKLAAFREAGLPLSSPLIEAAAEAGDAHKIIHYLGRNLDEAERIMNLPPHKMGAALAKLATKDIAPRAQSKAPAPIKPIAGKGKVELSDEDVSIEEYVRREQERNATRRGRFG